MFVLHRFRGWKLGALAGLAVVLVTLIPQVSLWIVRGREWQGAYAFTDPDELAYSAYLNSLILGQPRRNNPYLGIHDAPVATTESLFSVQFLPPYVLSKIGRIFSLSASTIFVIVTPVTAFLSAMSIFWLLATVTRENGLAATGALIVLLGAILVSESPFATVQSYGTIAFTRRYIPAVPFPLFMFLCLCVWRAFSQRQRGAFVWSIAAGLSLAGLVYSYVYLWTAAAAWIFCLTALWIAARREDRFHVAKCVSVIAAIGIAALVPYFKLLLDRGRTVDPKYLELTHAPDVFRFVEIVGGFMVIVIAWNIWRGKINWKSTQLIFAASCCIAPFLVFNQQVVTGRSLQPFHYEQFIINYVLLIGIVIIYRLVWWHVRIRPGLWVALALVAGLATSLKSTVANQKLNVARDETVPVVRRVKEIEDQAPTKGVVLFDRAWLAASAPTHILLHVLWSPYSYTYGTDPTEDVERFYQYLYYKGTDGETLRKGLKNEPLYRGVVFGLHRENTKLSRNPNPISDEEILAESRKYEAYANDFSHRQALRLPLSFVVVADARSMDFSNLDRWYVRDRGEQIGSFTVYRVELRSTGSIPE